MIESIRKDKRSVLLLDCGEVFDSKRDGAELLLKAMDRMGYDVLNLGIPELSFGKEFLERACSQVSFPYVASNLLYNGGRLPWVREYVIKEVAGIKAAVLGVIDPEDFKKISSWDDLKGFEVIPPEAALKRLLSEVRGKADLVILLSQLSETRNRALVDAARGIDVAISSGYKDIFNSKPPQQDTVVVLHTGIRGTMIGLVTIMLDDKGMRSEVERRSVDLDRSVRDDGEILRLVEAYNKEQEVKKEKIKKELMEGLKLTPEEFMERYRKNKPN